MISEECIKKNLSDNARKYKITTFERVSSTNTLLRNAAVEGAEENTVYIAEEQTAGKGRKNRSFFSPPGGGLYISILLRPHIPVEDTLFITTSAAVAVCKAIESSTGEKPQIKWVNDIILNGKKVCGILTESAIVNDNIDYAVLGIGINVFSPSCGFPDELKDIAGALCSEEKACLRELIAATILNEFSVFSDFSIINREYKEKSIAFGKSISVINSANGETYKALVEDIDEKCRLVVIDENGERKTLSSGEISIRL